MKYDLNNDIWLNAPVQEVFAFFAQHEHFVSLFGDQKCSIKSLATDGSNNGVGSIRLLHQMGGFEETIRRFEPNQGLEYEVTRYGLLPIRNHYGTLTFKPHNNGTQVSYHITFTDIIPFSGWLVKAILTQAWRKHALATFNARKVGAT